METCPPEAQRTVWREQREETEKSKQLKATFLSNSGISSHTELQV